MIYDDLSYQHEADIFANQMKNVKPLVPYEVFMANLEAGSDDQLLIRDLVESYGLSISNKRAPGNIVAVSTLEGIFKKYGYHTLDRTLRLCIGAWEGDINSFGANMMNAIAKLISVYGDTLNDEVFKEKLGAVSVKSLTRIARERKSGSLGFAEAMILEYNGRKKNSIHRLQMGKLYAKDNKLFNDLDDVPESDADSDQIAIEEDEETFVVEPKKEELASEHL